MDEHEIPPVGRPPNHVVPASAGFTEVTQYTDWYVADRGLGIWPNYRRNQPNYRYRRYLEALGLLNAGGRREAQVDIGCGAGLFSWAFLDWARAQEIAYSNIDLYGYDHCRAIISLAGTIRDELIQRAPDYPILHYEHNIDSFLSLLTGQSQPDTDYNVTLGHVLVQSQAPDDIRTFTRIILHVLELLEPNCNCMLVALDSRRSSNVFADGWNELFRMLVAAGVEYQQIDVPRTAISNSNDTKLAIVQLNS